MQIAEQMHAAGIGVFPCTADKKPAVGKDVDWREVALHPPSTQRWPSELVGMPIPQGAVVIDLDTYKGVTREAVEQILGCALPWDAALIQTTLQGGQHYAFSVDWPVKQGSDLYEDQIGKGLDTRTAGRGYICTGTGYTTHGFGVMAFAYPASLPRLPDAARGALERVAPTRPERPDIEHTTDVDQIAEALHHIDPDCSRSDWIRTGIALRALTAEDPDTGLSLFDAWSSGEYCDAGCPSTYEPEHTTRDWWSFKPQGETTGATLFYQAIQGGWSPPSTFDTAGAFGAGSAPVEALTAVLTRIQESGCDPSQTNALIAEVTAAGGNAVQTSVLLAALQRELREADLLTKPVRELLDQAAGGTALNKPRGMYGKNHTENAATFSAKRYPNGALLRSEQVWYQYTGRGWAEVDDDDLQHQLATDMAPCFPQTADVTGTYTMLTRLAHAVGRRISDRPDSLILFQNGVLDLATGVLMAHDPKYFTTNVLPYNYNPAATCGHWLTFLDQVFEGDPERVALLQEWFGYMLSSSYAFHKVLFMLGPGRSGKGTIGRVLEQIVGPQNYTGGSLHAFTSDSFIDSLRSKPVMFIGDSEKSVGRNHVDHVIERIKKISGNDAVAFDRKYKSTLSETLPTRITIAANGVPRLFDDSGALADRMLMLTFDVSFLNREDPHLIGKLLADIEGVAIWSLQGMARLNAVSRFTEPAAAADERRMLRESYSPLEQFIEEACALGTDDTTSSNDLYDAYHAWAITNREDRILPPRSMVGAFKDSTRGRGCRYGTHRIDGTPVRGFKGLTLTRGAQATTAGTAAAFKPTVVAT